MRELFQFDGLTALVTGASSGMGRRMAVLLAQHGAAVAVAARSEDRLVELVGEIEAAGGKALSVKLDVTDAAAIPPAIDRIEASLGPVSILINNAGISTRKRIVKTTLADYEDMMNVNLRGPYFLAAEIGKRLIARGATGSILNVASASGIKPMPGFSVYSISKAAVIQMTKVMALEWAANQINVNAICPGYILSGMTAELAENESGRRLQAGLPRQRMGVPEDLDCMVTALVSPANRFTTGAIVVVDDGISVS
jgi:NAD(P)-dependent dehydrogenase (short-subunit alcohol dehydrogenase family)